MRNPYGELELDNITGDFGELITRGNIRRAKKRKKKNTGLRVRRRKIKKVSHKRTRKHKAIKRSKGSKRPYPHWLKKYWFKKKR